MERMSLVVDITGLPDERLLFAASPLAELTAMLHVLAAPPHHPASVSWAARVRAGLGAELSERLGEAEFLWRSSRADFLLPAHPAATLAEELDAVDAIDDDRFVSAALVTTCGSDRVLFGTPSPLVDAASRDRALDLALARGPQQAAFAERLMAEPGAVRARLRRTLEACGPAFFDETWRRIRPQLAADLRHKAELRAHRGLDDTLRAVSAAISLEQPSRAGDTPRRIVVDKLQDNSTSALGEGVTFIPSVFGEPHLVCVHAPGWRPVLQYPVASPGAAAPVPMDAVARRLEALAHPVRLRLVRTLARGQHTTGELASAWELTAPEVSRHLAVLRRAGLLTAVRRGRYVHYELDSRVIASLGADLLEAVLR
jgi:DNA-binding transcriptional ArsR family regulator